MLNQTDKKDNTFPILEEVGKDCKKSNNRQEKKKRPHSTMSEQHKTKNLIPKINASKEDVTFYKMLRLTDSYV